MFGHRRRGSAPDEGAPTHAREFVRVLGDNDRSFLAGGKHEYRLAQLGDVPPRVLEPTPPFIRTELVRLRGERATANLNVRAALPEYRWAVVRVHSSDVPRVTNFYAKGLLQRHQRAQGCVRRTFTEGRVD